MRIAVLVMLVVGAGSAWATNTNTEVTLAQISARAVEAKYGRADQAWRDLSQLLGGRREAASPLGSVVATTTHKGPSPIVGEVIDIDVKRKLPWASISKAVAKALPLISTAVAIAEIAEAIRCREAAGGGAECDNGTSETTQTQWCVARFISEDPVAIYCRPSASAAHSAAAAFVKTSPATAPGYPSGTRIDRARINSNSGNCANYSSQVEFTGMGPYNSVGEWSVYGNRCATSESVLACPEVVVNGVSLVPVKGPDGKCMTNVYVPAGEEVVAGKVENYGDKTKAPQIVDDLFDGKVPVDHPFPEIDPVPGQINGPRETTSHPDGSTTTRDTKWDLVPKPNGYEWVPSIVTKDWPPGVTPDPPGSVSDGTTTSGGAAPERDVITCGLPDTPACKIDETGTPTRGDLGTAEGELAEKRGELVGALGEASHARSSLPWSWVLDFPVGSCTPFVWDTRLGTLTIDPCSSAGVDLWRALCAWFLFALTGLHIWRSVNEALAG